MLKTRFAVGATVLVAAAAASAQVGLYSLKYTPKVGTVTKYKMTGEFDVQGMVIQLTAGISNVVVKVEADGKYVLEEQQTDTRVVVNGEETEMPSGGAVNTTYDASGRVLEIKGESIDSSAYRAAAMSGFFRSEKAVKVGDTWTVELKADDKIGTVATKAVYTVEGEEAVGEFKTLRIKYDVRETTGSMPASSTGTIWIDHRDGEMVKVQGEWKDVPVAGMPIVISGKLTVVRQ